MSAAETRQIEARAGHFERAVRLAAWLALFAGAAYLRFNAIDWGAPFVYHPDEHFVLQPALDIVRTGDLNPHWFQYPSLLIYVEASLVYLVQPFVHASLQTNYLINGIGPWDALPGQWPFVLGGRMIVAASAVISILLLARVGARLYGAGAGLLAGVFLTVAALHNESSHYLTTDVPATTLLIACMAATVARRPNWVLAGLLAGFAAGTKYTASIALMVPLLAALDAPESGVPPQSLPWMQRMREVIEGQLRAIFGFVGGFLVSTPYALLDVAEFWDGILAQRQNYFAWKGQQGNLWWYLRYLYDTGLGPALAVVCAIGLICAAVRLIAAFRRRQAFGLRLAVLLPPLVYVPWLASYPSRAERNLILVLPFLCLVAAELVSRVCSLLRQPLLVILSYFVLGGAIVLSSVAPLLQLERQLQQPDNRSEALAWIRANLPRGTKIAREEYTPQIPTDEYSVEYLFSLARRPYSQYLTTGVQYLVASSNIYDRAVQPPYITGAAGREFYRVLFGLPMVKEFPQGPFHPGPTIRVYRLPLAETQDGK